MQKKIIALAIATMVSAPAFADNSNITIYGIADLSYDFISTGTSVTPAQAGVSKRNVSSNVSRLGLKGSENLGDGLAAIWQIEQQVNMDNAGGTFATRNTFLGLKSDGMGTVLLGRHDTPYKIATRKLDVFGDSIADNRALMGGVQGKSAVAAYDGRQPDVVAYVSPAVSGFTGAIAYVNLAEANTNVTQSNANALSLAGMYDAGPFSGSLAYEEHKIGAGTLLGAVGSLPAATVMPAAIKESATKLGLGYTMDALSVGFVYEKTKDDAGAAGASLLGHNAYSLSGQYKFGNDAVKLAYDKAGQIGSTLNSSANQFSLGYDHGLSKRTKLYAIYSRINNQSGASYGFSQTTAASINGVGASPSVVSLGMKHVF